MNYSDLRNLQALQKNENAIYNDEMTMSEISCLLHSCRFTKTAPNFTEMQGTIIGLTEMHVLSFVHP